MSTSAFKKYMEIFSDKDWVANLERWIGNDVLEKDTHTFVVPPNKSLRISEGRWKLLVGHAVNVITAMTDEDVPEKELQNAYRYLFVCINCIKYGLDPNAAKEALDIEEYEKKYWRKQA